MGSVLNKIGRDVMTSPYVMIIILCKIAGLTICDEICFALGMRTSHVLSVSDRICFFYKTGGPA